jgi:hypothetical protein
VIPQSSYAERSGPAYGGVSAAAATTR